LPYESLRAFAKRIESAPSYAHKLKTQGRLVIAMVDGKELVDVEKSLKRIKDTVDVGKQYMVQVNDGQRAKHRAPPQQKDEAPEHAPPDDDAPDDDGLMDSGTVSIAERYNKARAEREHFESKIKELKLLEMRGELVRAADVEAMWAKRIMALRERLLQVPDRLAPVVIPVSDLPAAREVIATEMNDVMRSMHHGRA